MKNIEIELKKVYERDMDLLILEEFVADSGFAALFLDKVGLDSNYTIEKAVHSLADSNGESDIAFTLRYPQQKVGLLIEDKIDAPTMPDQSLRYQQRATAAKQKGDYDDFRVILAAPAEYHKEHATDSNADYTYRITYEELRDYLSRQQDPRANFKAALVDFAITEKRKGYQVQEVEAVTKFWGELRRFCKENYPNLTMLGKDSPKGASACWPEFRTSLGSIKIIYKAQKGFVDLEFPGYGDKIGRLYTIIKDKKSAAMTFQKTNKSASLRIADERWIIDFSQDFASNQSAIDAVLQAVSQLCELADQLNYDDLY